MKSPIGQTINSDWYHNLYFNDPITMLEPILQTLKFAIESRKENNFEVNIS